MSQPIDYARAESDDVVRKKFRRRVVWFVMATVVVMGIGVGWMRSPPNPPWLTYFSYGNPVRLIHAGGWIIVFGPQREKSRFDGFDQGSADYFRYERRTGNDQLGVRFIEIDIVSVSKWRLQIRYRTLFLLATIPWLITLIRLIRAGRVRHVARIEQ